MKHLKIFWPVLVLVGCIVFCAACNDDDENETPNNIDDVEDLVYTEAQIDSMNYDMLLDAIAPYKRDSTATMPEREVCIGRCLFPARADEFYVKADSLEEASEHFLNIILPVDLRDKVQKSGDSWTVTVLDATLTFQLSEQTGILAEVDVDIPQLTMIKKIYYVRSAEWPVNADTATPFEGGEIVYNAKTGYFYICAIPSSYSNGILVTVNDLYVDWYTKHNYWQGNFYVINYNASNEAFVALRKYATERRDMYKSKLRLLAQYVEGTKNGNASGLLSFLLNIGNLERDAKKDLTDSACFVDKKADVRYIIGNTRYSTTLYWWRYYYVVWFDYYYCADMCNYHYKTPNRKSHPRESDYLGTSQIIFGTYPARDYSVWKSIVK
jgi:hypothetical protein